MLSPSLTEGSTPRRILVGGGVRSGKSRFALGRAMELGARRVFLATAEARDVEMEARVSAHVRERGETFRTVEEPLEIEARLAALQDVDVVLIDCLTLWLSNLLLAEVPPDAILERVARLGAWLSTAPFHSVIVSNEVGLGIVPEHRLARVFRDVSGSSHRSLAGVADELYFAVMGVMIRLKPGPLALVDAKPGGLDA